MKSIFLSSIQLLLIYYTLSKINSLSLETTNRLIIDTSTPLIYSRKVYLLYRYVIRCTRMKLGEKRREIISQHCSMSNTIRATNRFKDRFFEGGQRRSFYSNHSFQARPRSCIFRSRVFNRSAPKVFARVHIRDTHEARAKLYTVSHVMCSMQPCIPSNNTCP